jgi:hypothetical protein
VTGRLIVVVAILVLLGLTDRRLRDPLEAKARALRIWFFESKETWDVVETFFNEVAVLWFVFPLLDLLYQTKHAGDTNPPNIYMVVGSSWPVSLLFFTMAVFAKKRSEKIGSSKDTVGKK